MFAKKTQRPGGAQLLANWKAPLPEKRRRISKKPVKYNASASWGALKAGRDGRIPDAHEIDLIDPSEMGKPEQPNQPQVLQSESAQVQTTGPPAPEAVAPSNSVLPHRLPKDETQTGVRIALTCWGWTTGSCEMAAEKCAFLHKVGPGTASEALYRQFQKHYKGGIQQRKFALRDFVCKYWESGSCFKTITECHAAHFYWTDNVPMAPPPPPAAPSSSDAMDMSSVSGTEEQQYVFKIALTCPGWKQDHCSLGSETCCFLHHDSPRAASAELYRQYLDHEYGHHREPKFEDRTRICKFWQTKKRCVKHDTECTFAHFQWVRTLTAVSSSSLSAARLPPTGPSCVAEPRPASPTGLPPKSMTCFFWYNGGSCKKTEEACWFVHRLLPTIAPDPRRNKGQWIMI
ncbi:hypothetical protein EJ08DRAFT_476518 [Tothia fuscella]|uniref:C3H1-type domain-containing protein n=1 Tax=Tothia fuscella TaxID=1048955 RepID=A0A9P4TUE9_9PEZI|nr:hypothetical protein EJ08DRAFT_476518 [Tothia fuscella]